MLAQLRIKLKNAECAVAFLQTQHAKTLEGLHNEIQKLQQQNAKLTFELTMAGPQKEQTTGHQYECKHLEAELHQSKAEVLALRSHRGPVFSRELKERDDRVSMLLKEIEDKSDAVATLTNNCTGPCAAQEGLGWPENVKLRSNLAAVASGPSPPPSSSEGSRPSLSASSITQRPTLPLGCDTPLAESSPPFNFPLRGALSGEPAIPPKKCPTSQLTPAVRFPNDAHPCHPTSIGDVCGSCCCPGTAAQAGACSVSQAQQPAPRCGLHTTEPRKEMQVLGKTPSPRAPAYPIGRNTPAPSPLTIRPQLVTERQRPRR
eukprot:Em0011g936a